MIKSSKQITGVSLPEEHFRIHETCKSVDVASVFEVLRGNLAGYRIREYLTADACRQIVENFWRSEAKVPRFGYGEDGVEGYFIGASHIEKTTHEYLQEARMFEDAVKSLFAGTINPLAAFRDTLAFEGSGENMTFRPAKLNGLSAGDAKAVYWNSLGDFLLQPHEDFAQLKDPKQKDFEIQQASRVMAINFYAEAPTNSGQLKLWNIEPDNRSRADLDLTYSGFPYPAELLEEFPSIIIPVETGDLCVINGNLVHAVLRGDPVASAKQRLLITCFTTSNDNDEFIWWT